MKSSIVILISVCILIFSGCEDKSIVILPASANIKKVCTEKVLKIHDGSNEKIQEYNKCVEEHKSITKR